MDTAVFWAVRRRRMAGAVGGLGDTTAPTLTFPNALPLGDTSCYLEVTTNEGNGTLYYVVTTSVSAPSKAQVKAGQDHTGAAAAYAGSQAVSSTGAQTATGTGLSSATVYYGYFMHEDAAGNQSAVKALTTFTTLTTGTSDTSFDNLIAAASVAPASLRQGYIARFIQALYAASIWTKIDVLWVLAAHDEQFGRLNWKSPGTFTLTAVNSPTFTTDRGYTTNGSTSYVDTTWDRLNNGAQYTRDDAHISVYQLSGGNSNSTFSDTRTGSRAGVGARNTTGGGSFLVNSGTLTNGVTTGGYPTQAIARRNNSTQQSLIQDGAEVVAPSAANSAALENHDFAFGRYGHVYTGAQMSGGSVGAYLDDTESLAFFNAWYAYLQALGAVT